MWKRGAGKPVNCVKASADAEQSALPHLPLTLYPSPVRPLHWGRSHVGHLCWLSWPPVQLPSPTGAFRTSAYWVHFRRSMLLTDNTPFATLSSQGHHHPFAASRTSLSHLAAQSPLLLLPGPVPAPPPCSHVPFLPGNKRTAFTPTTVCVSNQTLWTF